MFSRFVNSACLKRAVIPLAVSMLCITTSVSNVSGNTGSQHEVVGDIILRAGDTSLAAWKLPELPESHNDGLIALGHKLFFDTRLSLDRNRSCASCHNPALGWSDGLATARGIDGKSLARATPSLNNAAYGTIFTWDGSAATLEEQATQPVFDNDEMGLDPEELLTRLRADAGYRRMFEDLFPERAINITAISSAIAAFERTIVVNNTRFDQWVAGDTTAMTPAEVRGFSVFLDPARGSCGTCHAAPNFTDDGFHNIGLESPASENHDSGRYKIRPVKLMRGAFKTPSLRNIALTAPYFHNGAADTLTDVIDHYVDGGDKSNLSPEMKEIELSAQEKNDLIAFLYSISESPETSLQNSISVAPE